MDYKNLPLKDGDTVGFSGGYFHSDLINLATYGIPRYSLSHVGILARKNKRSKWLVFEANEDVPWQCAVTHKKHDGVQAHSLDLLVERYQGKMWYYSLNNAHYAESQVGWEYKNTGFLYSMLCAELGTPYDWNGARRAGGKLWSLLHAIFRQEDTSSFFCSEFVATILREFGVFETDNVSKWSPNRLMRKLVRDAAYKQAVRIK